MYAATKAFDLLLGEALYVEQRRFGIDVLVVEPGSTDTEFHGVAGELPHAGESPEAVVESGARGARPPALGGVGLVQLAARERGAAARRRARSSCTSRTSTRGARRPRICSNAAGARDRGTGS